MPPSPAPGREKLLTIETIALFLAFTVVLLAVGYSAYYLAFNTYVCAAAVLFFAALFLALKGWPMKGAFDLYFDYVKKPVGAAAFGIYLALHYFLYGIFLEDLLVSIYGYASRPGSGIYLSGAIFYPATPVNALLSLIEVPSVNMWAPPSFGITLPPFSLFMGFTIAVLVTANIALVSRIANCPRRKRLTAYIALPAIGIITGSSCCLALPIVFTLAVPAAAVVTYTAVSSYAAFFAFPIGTAVALWLNLRHSQTILGRISASPDSADSAGDVSAEKNGREG